MIKSLTFDGMHGYVAENENTKNTLLGKTFTFSKDRINILFGRNGSGKSTILKTIAQHNFIEDGLFQRHNISAFGIDKITTAKELLDYIQSKSVKNSSIIEQTGTPIYYHNFKEKSRQGNSACGSLCGGMFNSMNQELSYILYRKGHSEGEVRMAEMDCVVSVLDNIKDVSMKDLLCREEHFISLLGVETSQSFDEKNPLHSALYEYYSQMEDFEKTECVLMLDEYDENLDMNYAWNILVDYLPNLQKQHNAQIILSTHNPIVLSNGISKSNKYNLISLDESYTEASREFLYKLFSK